MKIQSGNINKKLAKIKQHWTPYIIGELNNQHVKLAKLKGEFVWHKHDEEDEMFFILEGNLTIAFSDYTKQYKKNDFVIIPRGIKHKPYCEDEVSVMLFEPSTTLNTGDQKSNLTKSNLNKI